MTATDIARAVPFSIETEQAVLGALLNENDSIDCIPELRPEHFYSGEHREIFKAIVAALEGSRPADVLTIAEALPKIDFGYISSLANGHTSSANVVRYTEMVIDRAQKRGLLAIASDIEASTLAEKSPSSRELIDETQSKLDRLAEVTVTSEPIPVREGILTFVNTLEDREAGRLPAIPTGFDDLDSMLNGGIAKGELVALAARPAMGKSVMAFNIACNAAADHNVLVLSLEMPSIQIHDRNVASVGKIPLSHIFKPSLLTEHEWSKITFALDKISRMNLHIDDQAGLRLLDVKLKARKVKRKAGLDLIVIDYLQLMRMPSSNENRAVQIGELTGGLKTLAKEMNVGILMLSQLNRELEKRPNKRPMLSDLRESGSIEQDSDKVIFIYRDEVYNPDTMDKGVAEIIVGKHRNGQIGTVGMSFTGDQVRFDSLEYGATFGRSPARKERYSGLRD